MLAKHKEAAGINRIINMIFHNTIKPKGTGVGRFLNKPVTDGSARQVMPLSGFRRIKLKRSFQGDWGTGGLSYCWQEGTRVKRKGSKKPCPCANRERCPPLFTQGQVLVAVEGRPVGCGHVSLPLTKLAPKAGK